MPSLQILLYSCVALMLLFGAALANTFENPPFTTDGLLLCEGTGFFMGKAISDNIVSISDQSGIMLAEGAVSGTL